MGLFPTLATFPVKHNPQHTAHETGTLPKNKLTTARTKTETKFDEEPSLAKFVGTEADRRQPKKTDEK
jgi:hypothetical protein